MVESAQPDIADKLSELLKAVERSIKAREQNKETLTEAHELGTRKHTDLIKSQQEQQAQLATLISQSTLQIGPAIHQTPFYGKPTDDLLSFISHFESSRISAVGMTTNVLELCHFIYRVMLVHGMQVLIQKH
ncbi:Hypothetical predicted protein [Paramuricea clavata]|uniref:Uncharacterized protein n=1 Tax=Paramuricea clavata TaxID=317549 RepID=A0A6S7JLS5_PARCT|nr:Hypothetical predicted protein [Paramuricea clavata]